MNALPQTISSTEAFVPAGFASAVNDSNHHKVSLDNYLVTNPSSTVLFRVRGESMRDAGIFDGDLLVVDRSISPMHGQIVVASVNYELTVKRLFALAGQVKLQAANPEFEDITFRESDEMFVWGVVTFSLRRLS
jgi:DNA polymerase V